MQKIETKKKEEKMKIEKGTPQYYAAMVLFMIIVARLGFIVGNLLWILTH